MIDIVFVTIDIASFIAVLMRLMLFFVLFSVLFRHFASFIDIRKLPHASMTPEMTPNTIKYPKPTPEGV